MNTGVSSCQVSSNRITAITTITLLKLKNHQWLLLVIDPGVVCHGLSTAD
jgi:hypothetical protein